MINDNAIVGKLGSKSELVSESKLGFGSELGSGDDVTREEHASGTDKHSRLQANAQTIAAEIHWCEQVIATRLQLHFQQECAYASVYEVVPPSISFSSHTTVDEDVTHFSPYADFIIQHQLDFKERLLLILALLPFVKPNALDVFLVQNEQINRPFTEFGGTYLDDVYVATGETWAFLLASQKGSIADRLALQQYLAIQTGNGNLHSPNMNVLDLLDASVPEKRRDGFFLPLILAKEYVPFFTTGEEYKAILPANFPAQLITTERQWDSLSLPSKVMAQLEEIQAWAKFHHTLLHEWNLATKIRPGFRALFYGPPGTGKTLTVGVLANALGRQVYKIDLSMMLSKYIGETEKNLEQVFTLAEQHNWLLFFDEADALFGKRTQANSANDQFANQNVSYLLQRIERFHGVVILASNYKENLDDAFLRRFESIVYFPKPDTEQRLQLWQSGFSDKTQLDANIDLHGIAAKYALTGASIMNVIRYASLKALMEERTVILQRDIQEGIQREQSQGIAPRW
ncbi:ATP-binding protein [Marinomonas agarivorans]|nr:ATP-binding protein [Marinomonas agarivorans]